MSKETEQIEARLCAYVDGELDEAARKEIERQLASDPRHRQMVDDLIRVREMLRELPRQDAPPEIEETLHHHLERSLLLDETPGAGAPLRINRWPQFVSAAAILLLAIGLAVIVWLVIRPPREHPSAVSMSPPASNQSGATMEKTAPGNILSDSPKSNGIAPPNAPRIMSRGSVPDTQPSTNRQSADQLWARALGKPTAPADGFAPLPEAESTSSQPALDQVGLVVKAADLPETRLRIHAYLSAQSLHATWMDVPTVWPWAADDSLKCLQVQGITREQVASLRRLLETSARTELIPLTSPSGLSGEASAATTQSAEPTWPDLLDQAAAVSKVDLLILLRPGNAAPETSESPLHPTTDTLQPETQPAQLTQPTPPAPPAQPATQPSDTDAFEPVPMP